MHTGEGYHIGSLPFLEELRWYPRSRAPIFRPNRVTGYALSLSPSPFRTDGKEENMSIPYVSEFDYDLWTTEDGKYWVKIRSTGEITEISKEVMELLRSEERQLRRRSEPLEDNASPYKRQLYEVSHPLSLDCPEERLETAQKPYWAVSSNDVEKEYLDNETLRDLIQSLTPRQADLFHCCVYLGWSQSEYARKKGISRQSVSESFMQIAKKLKKLDWIP